MNPQQHAAWGIISAKLSPAGKQELVDLLDYMRERAYNNSLPEGSIARLLNKQSPEIRDAMEVLSNVITHTRDRPFDEKWDEQQSAEALGLDPRAAEHLQAALDGEEVAGSLQQRMGSDRDLPVEPLTMADEISAAIDFHGEQNG